MKSKTKEEKPFINKWRNTVLLTLWGMAFAGFVTLFIYKKTLYKPLSLLAFIELLPMAVNLILTIPRWVSKKVQESEKVENEQQEVQTESEPAAKETAEESAENKNDKVLKSKKNKRKNKKSNDNHNLSISLASFYNKTRHIIVAVLIVIVTIWMSISFWTSFKFVNTTQPILSYLTPTILAATWILFLVLSNFCRFFAREHKIDDTDNEEEKATNKYNAAILMGLRGALIIGMISIVIVFASSILHNLNFHKFGGYAVIALAVIFFYEMVFVVISLISRLIRHEINTAPEFIIPVPSVSGSDLSIVSYLENNTGMTMRSLWSMKMIKKVIPFCAVFIVVLLWFFSGIVKIEPYQHGAHYRLGKLMDEPLNPGLHLTLPWPFDEVNVYETERVNKMTIGYLSEEDSDNLWTAGHGGEEYKLLLGGGKELVSINLRVEYKISDLNKYVKNSASPEMILQASAYEAITERTISTDLETLLSSDREALSVDLKEDISKRSGIYDTGIEVVSVILESIHPPVEIAEIYQQIISAEIDAEKIILDAQASAVVRVTRAKTRYDSQVNFEKKVHYMSVANAKSEVADFMSCVEADKEYKDQYRYRKYLDALTKAYSGGKIVIVGDGIDEKHIYIGNFGNNQ